MTHKHDGSGRRILTSPAVHPCEGISPATLLNSLISLTHSISNYKSKFFASNKRNSRESIRQIGILQLFLEETRNLNPNLPDSVTLSFSELYFTFQKLRHLLEDCTHEGARLWILAKSERVANQFRVLSRAIATALDVLPLDSIHVPLEVKECIELLMRQARKTRFDVDPDDRAAKKLIISILNRFEDEILPDRNDLKRVLDYLGISSWSECNEEVKFLDSEISLEWINDENRDVGFLSSLLGFMSYCRCVFFDTVSKTSSHSENRGGCSSAELVLSFLNSDDFRCPISLEFMIDPVTLSTGHTYDRASILKWFGAGNKTCPKTGQKVANTELVQNLALRRLIQQYCLENGIPMTAESGRRNRDTVKAVLAGSSAAEGTMRMLTSFLATRLEAGTWEEKNRGAYEIRILSKTSVFNRSCLVESGVIIPQLLRLLSSKYSSIQENAIAALMNLSKHSKGKAMIVENGGLDSIVSVLNKGLETHARYHAAGLLFYIASIEEYRRLIGEIPEAISGLIELIRDGTDRGKKNAMVAIFGLLMNNDNRSRVIAAGAVPLLVNILKSSDREDLLTDCLAILATLAEKPDGTVAILHSGTLNFIVGVFNSSTSRAGKEYCVSLLLALCMNGGGDVVALLGKSPSLMGSLYSLLNEGTSRASKKASTLIRVLHEFYERRPSGSISPVLRQERFVHVW